MEDKVQAGAVFFDRDGVLNVDTGYLIRPEEFRWVNGAREALRATQEAGLLAIVVTNQSGVARGFFTQADVDALHAWMRQDLAKDGLEITAFYSCPYHEAGIIETYRTADHVDRKPNPGMILRAMTDWHIAPERSFIVGDKDSDIEAGNRAGIEAVLFRGGNLAETIRPMIERVRNMAQG